MKLTEKYGIKSPIEFTDIELDCDTPKFIDPFLIYIDETEFGRSCSNAIVEYFKQLLDAAQKNDLNKGTKLTVNLKENNETKLGYSRNKPRGNGLGEKKGIQLFNIIKESEAMKTGLVKDIFDINIMIPRIDKDIISDLVTNIVLEKFISFTQEICLKYNIPMKKIKLKRPVWSIEEKKWIKNYIAELPEHNNNPIILVPDKYTNKSFIFSIYNFYHQQMMPFYCRKVINDPSSGLVKILKRGKVPSKVKIKKAYPLKKENVITFIKDHPEEYKEFKRKHEKYYKFK